MQKDKIERDLGPQPLAKLMQEHGLSNHDLVTASARPITHKMVARAAKGRRLTINAKSLVLDAYNRATGEALHAVDLFNY